ncbi:MAG: WecB/TagA/CpsF family glycosyltransferase [Candidatus Riflebacteria bacterium]|nr:WecB/TagA/CpsF family glycosyltransferase [Candidatus Riflebacteria bacterium]
MENEKIILSEKLHNRFSWYGIYSSKIRGIFRKIIWYLLIPGTQLTKRLLDLLLALLFLILYSPAIILIVQWLVITKQEIFSVKLKYGRYCEPFHELSFNIPDTLFGRFFKFFGTDKSALLINILKGEMSFVGPRAALINELTPEEIKNRQHYDIKPGLICLWWVRSRANISFDSEIESDKEYMEKSGLMTDIGIAFRALPVLLYGGQDWEAPEKIQILGIQIDNLTMNEAISKLLSWVSLGNHAIVSFVNADCANISAKDINYFHALNSSHLVLADGIGMKIAGKILAKNIRQNVNGTDLFPRILERLAVKGSSVYLFGGRPGVPEAVENWIRENFPGVVICGVRNGYFSPEEEPEIISEIFRRKPDVLFVAMGAPFQEKWLQKNFRATGAKIGMGVGGLFDFYSGRIQRAPQWVREIGMEWFFRFWQEPGRLWKRYFVGNFTFLGRVILERLNLWKHF